MAGSGGGRHKDRPCRAPPPHPSPASGGGSRPSLRIELQTSASATSFRDGSGARLPLALAALQGDGAGGRENGGRGFAPSERLRREVVDRDGGGDGIRGGAKLFRLGLGDQVLRARLIDVADMRLVQAIAQR